ncbi:MAG: DUF58 domain-containing protein [Clostridia bacterium]|nr:DUF58 domain-containing protein [Clostridia bacterium]
MLFLAAAAAVVSVILLQYFLYKRHSFDHVEYRAYFSESEVYTGDDIYLYEEIANTGKIPLPFIKIETELPDGLKFTLLEDSSAHKKNGKTSVTEEKLTARYEGRVHSMFVLRPGSVIKRRWRVICRVRGEYRLDGALATATDILGYLAVSKRIMPSEDKRTSVTVLPLPEELDGKYASSKYICGDAISNICPVTDPVRICGSRDYTPSDPMNRVNWKSTAAHGRLMVNIEEKTVRHRFSILFNMNSREIEQYPDSPSDPASVERGIILCASVLDRIAAEDLPVSIFLNTDPSSSEMLKPVSDGEQGSKISASGPFRGRSDTVYALRMLSSLKMSISLPAERFFDHVASNPRLYSENENLIVISPYLDERMLNLRKALSGYGVNVIYYISTSRNSLGQIPADADVYFLL